MSTIHFDEGTTQGVINALNYARNTQQRVRIFLGNTESGEDWCEEYYTTGTVSTSCGTKPCAILVHNRRSLGGCSILTANVLKVVTIEDGRTIYVAPNYKQPVFEVKRNTTPIDALEYEVFRTLEDNKTKLYARFDNYASAKRYALFMEGKINSKSGKLAKQYQ